MNELKPCPFCGGEASWIAARQREDGTYYPAACGCRKCGIWRYGESNYGHGGFATEDDRKVSMEQAASKWNARTPEQAIAATLGGSGCEYCDSGVRGFDGQVVMISNHGWQKIHYCPNCGREVVDA